MLDRPIGDTSTSEICNMSKPALDINDKEFNDEIRRGLIIIMRAMIRKYHLSWVDFLPREENAYIRRLAVNHGTAGEVMNNYGVIEPVANPSKRV